MIFLIDLSISGLMFAEIVGGFMLFVLAIILGFKIFLKNKKEQLLQNPKETQNSLSKKYSAVDILRHSQSFFQVGLVCSLGIVAMAFQWTIYDSETVQLEDNYEIFEIDEDIPIVRTPRQQKSQPIPIPKPTTHITPLIDVIEPDEPETFIPPTIEPVEIPKTAVVKTPKKKPKPKPIFVEPEDVEPHVDPIQDVVEQMPLFSKSCLDEENKDQCSGAKLLSFVHSHMTYPAIARENNIEGTVVIQFVIEKDGSISNPKIMKDIGGGCGKEALRVVKLMDKWLPGRQRDHLVRVRFNLPVKFKLQN